MRKPNARTPMYKRQVVVGGQPVTYKVAGPRPGEGEPVESVVLVHGLAGSIRWWANTLPALAPCYPVYLVDLPGFGSMRRFPGGFVLEQAASWLNAWLRAVGLRRVHLVGHSMGAYICLHVAALNPYAVASLVLIAPAGVPSSRSAFGHVWPLIQECLLSAPRLLPLLLRDTLRAGPLAVWRAAQDLLAQDVRNDLKLVQAPTLLIWGEKDVLVPPSLGVVLRQELAHSRLLIIKGSHHVPMIDRPLVLNRALLSFLAGQSVGR